MLIETGTYYGHMVAAMKPHFDRIYSIELGAELCELARQKFAKDGHISILHGDSAEVLRELLPQINQPCLFWLDAHYSVAVTARGDKRTPILAELAAILSHPVPGHVILVDDAREFGVKEDWPRLDELQALVNSYDESLRFTVQDDILRINGSTAAVRTPLNQASLGGRPPTLSFVNQPNAAHTSRMVEKADSPLVSVVIPSYNYAQFIEQTIQSVLNQTFTDIEIIVVDDGSTDNTRTVVEGFGAPVRYIYQENAGVGAARNKGIKEAQGRYVGLLDADDLWLPMKLEKQLQLFAANPEVALVYSLFYSFDSESGAITGYKPKAECFRGYVLREMFQSCMVGSPPPLIRKEIFDDVGPFSEDLNEIEDYEMWLRICASYKIDFLPECLAMYRVHQSIWSNAHSLENWTRSITQIITRCYGRHPGYFTESELRDRLLSLYQVGAERAYLTGHKVLALEFLRCAHSQRARWNHWLWWLAINLCKRSETDYNRAIAHYQRGKILLAKGACGNALNNFVRSLWSNPFRPKAWGGLLLCLLPKVLSKKLFSGSKRIFVSQPTPGQTARYSQY